MIQLLQNIDFLFDFFVIRHLPVLCLFLLVVDLLWKKHSFRFSYQIIRVIVLLNWLFLLLFLIIGAMQINSIRESTGVYWWMYWVLMLSALVLPIALIPKKWGKKKGLILVTAVLTSLSSSMELYVILITSLHHDFGTGLTKMSYFSVLILRPFIIICFLVSIDVIFFRNKTKSTLESIATDEILDSD